MFQVSAITMRKDPIYLTTFTGRPPDEPSVLGEALNEVFIPLLRQQFPEIVDFWLPPEGCSYRIAVVSMKKAYPGHAKRVMMGVWSYLRQFMYTKWVIVVDDDIDARDWKDVMWAISTRMDPARDITVIENTPIDYLDFASPESGLGSKIGLDATNKWPPETHREWGEQARAWTQTTVDAVTADVGAAGPARRRQAGRLTLRARRTATNCAADGGNRGKTPWMHAFRPCGRALGRAASVPAPGAVGAGGAPAAQARRRAGRRRHAGAGPGHPRLRQRHGICARPAWSAIAVLALAGAPPLVVHAVGLTLLRGPRAHAVGLSRSGGASVPRGRRRDRHLARLHPGAAWRCCSTRSPSGFACRGGPALRHMPRMDENLLNDVVAAALAAGADAAEAVGAERRALSITVRLGDLEEVEREESRDLGLRVFVGQRQATVSGSDISAEARAKLVERAVAMARLAPEDPYAGLADRRPPGPRRPARPRPLRPRPSPRAEALEEPRPAPPRTPPAPCPKVTNSDGGSASWSARPLAAW